MNESPDEFDNDSNDPAHSGSSAWKNARLQVAENKRLHALKCCLVFILVVSVFISETFLFLLLWRWFLIPLGVPEITFVHAFGIYLLWSFIKLPNYKKSRTDESSNFEYWKGYVGHSYTVIIIILVLSWPTHLIMLNQ